ncbi:MAG: hypothetical protein ABJP34_00455 [Erythrobacter sp.]
MPIIETLIGAASGVILLAAFSRLSAKSLADYGFLAFAIMVSIYFGARLVTGSMNEIIAEFVAVNIALGLTWFAMQKWLPTIGIVIFLHGTYDAFFGKHTGVAEWYPYLCAGFDLAVGIGLLLILHRKLKGAEPA